MRLRQPDGSTVEVRIWGDEFYQIVESLDGYTLVRDPATKSICYARPSDDKRQLLSTKTPFGTGDPRSMGLKKHLRASLDTVRNQVMAARTAYQPKGSGAAVKTADTGQPIPATTSTGTVRGICLLVDFGDDPGIIAPSTAESFCNQPGFALYDNNGSVHDYFHDVSLGRLNYTNHLPTQYYRAQFPKSYYDDANVTYGVRARELITEALTAMDAAGFDFSQYDADHNGTIDALNCFYAGTTTCGWAAGLWPHASTVSFTADGVSTYRYQISDMGSELRLDTFCHENGHMLCNWPDLYDYDFDSQGVGRFCLMCDMASPTNPVQPCAYLKYVAGWTDTTLLVTQQTGYTITSGQNQVYKYEHPTWLNEYYLIENRQKTGRDSALPDAGLALWHIDTEGSNDFQQGGGALHYKVALVQADGRWDLESNRNPGDGTDLWKGPTFTNCSAATTPNTNWWNGTTSGLGISEISASGSTMSFTFGSSAILVNKDQIKHIIYPGTPVPNDTFTITNTSTIIPMDYTLETNENWLTMTPGSGSSLGETHTITVSFNNAVIPYWPNGTYGAVVTVHAPGAQNNPEFLVVQVIIGSVRPDLDHDQDVDQADFGLLQECLTGYGVDLTKEACRKADFDLDNDVDHQDVDIFRGCLSGPDTQADLNCQPAP